MSTSFKPTDLAKFIRANAIMNLKCLGPPNGFNYFKFDSSATMAKKREKLEKILSELDDPEFAYRKYYACSYYAGSVNLDSFETKLSSLSELKVLSDVELVERIINNWVPSRVKRSTILHFPKTLEFDKLIRKLQVNPNYMIDIFEHDDYREIEIVRRERKRVNVAEHEALTVFNRFYLAQLFKTNSVTIASFLPWSDYLTKLGYKIDINDDKIITINLN